MQELDPVVSGGIYLINRPNTPIHKHQFSENEFATAVTHKLDKFLEELRKHSDAADEWLSRRSPPELARNRAAAEEEEEEKVYELMDVPSPPSACSGKDSPNTKVARESRGELLRILNKNGSDHHTKQSPVHCLPTPSCSHRGISRPAPGRVSSSSCRQSPLFTLAGISPETAVAGRKKRRRTDNTEEGETDFTQSQKKKICTATLAGPAKLRRSVRLQQKLSQ